MKKHLKISAVVAAMALLIPAAAVAKKGEKPAKSKAPAVKLVTANVFGEVTESDGATLTVTVAKASGQAKACAGKTLTFDVADAKVNTADNDADGDMDAADVVAGHLVKVRGKVAVSKGKKTTCAVEGQTTAAKAVHNRTTPKPEEAEETEGAES